jgi:D-arabinose 1-dehydrogenase-like Zn-dependent alcohol dehydrogenase
LIIGFGRFGQIVSQPLISRGCSVSIIDTNADNIRLAEGFGFKVYYGVDDRDRAPARDQRLADDLPEAAKPDDQGGSSTARPTRS